MLPLIVAPIGLGIRRVALRPHTLAAFVRLKSNLPQDFNPKKSLPSEGEWKHLKQHIPGENVQSNEIRDRIPRFPLVKESIPTLLPKPGVPQVGPKHTFRQVVQILKSKTQPELIYESEPHRLYFLACFCFATILTIYGLVLAEFAWFQANRDYEENEKEHNEALRKREWVFSLAKNSVFSIIALGAAFFAGKFPTRLIRRMWYMPGPVEHIKFTTYPMIPGRPTPVITIPLEHLTRRHKARVWTGKGFYGTADNSMFFFVLNEAIGGGKRTRNWIVDRKGFFWSDGRVFDFLFGKETLAEAEAGIPYDEQIGIMNREVKKKKKQLRAEHGMFYQWKWGAKELQKDIGVAGSYVKSLRSKDKDNVGKIGGKKH
ncbi:uncharacterized protein CANTADRAFT_6905 [Suhomyces tanzawaensis NRRL Y-17324]|uniref:Uncharacterized protein n=1 Tax=Suhomyces tanzawaensis NRRL Y-17324 TaxID=984487 RepID=A0A1E4SG98_9ASCO|nr:uncharacterized protein CANTADRAFT_6905 [Suhomyces tanzawaensis NRRL Y-17324]ODV78539.1 hypothetical protein CANTADRAFT_6905 [Suhomyces tanzawaensis NRRL Y-17324]